MENIDEIVVHVRENGEDTTTDGVLVNVQDEGEEATSEVAVDVQEVGEPERSADSGTKLIINEALIIESIKQKVQEPSRINSFTILPVDYKLRRGNDDVYTPQLVTIGPYHHFGICLEFKEMQDVKSVYFYDLIKRSSKDPDPVPQYVEAVSKNAAEAKKRYLGTDNLTNEQFVEMMVMDGCFLIEFLLKYCEEEDQADIVKTKITELMNDLLLVENQIPFFILQDLLEVYKRLESKEDDDNSPITIEVLALFCFTGDRLVAQLAAKLFEEEEKSFHHLLHLYHSSLTSLNLERVWKETLEPERVWKLIFRYLHSLWNLYGLLCLIIPCIIPPVLIIWLVKTAWSLIIYFMGFILSKLWEWIIMLLLLPSIFCLLLMDNDDTGDAEFSTVGIPNARYLRNTGFNFKRKKTLCTIDVSCSGRTLEIPRLLILKTTIVRFKNLIALEYSRPNFYGRKVTGYAKFLDYLIDAKEDVAILRECDIIDNRLGEDAEVATFFNNLLKGIDVNDYDIPMCPFIQEYYTDGIGNYKVRFFQWRKKLVPEYFSNPWAVPSMIAAFILLVLTVLQTFFTIYPYYKPR